MNTTKWTKTKGINTSEPLNWDQFCALVESGYSRRPRYVFRGNSIESYPLLPKITRILRDITLFDPMLPRTAELTIERHLDRFTKIIRGRRGPNPEKYSEPNKWWALGQHYGLATPLLDWTRSPYIAAFFAFRNRASEITTPGAANPNRAIWVLDLETLEGISNLLIGHFDEHPEDKLNGGTPRQLIEVVLPSVEDNARLVSQAGLFTKIPYTCSLEQWAEKYASHDTGLLFKIIIRDTERSRILRALDQMNINESVLFPDIAGVSQYCNYMIEIDGGESKEPYKHDRGGVAVGLSVNDLAD